MNFGCIHIAWKHRKATEHVVKQFRRYHPNNPYTLISDRGFDYSKLANDYDLNYIHSYMNCHPMRMPNHPDEIYGITKNETLGWIHYFREACKHVAKHDGTHIILMEDDVLTQSKVVIDPKWECAGHYYPESNKLNLKLLEWIRNKYNVSPNVDWYGAGGGSVFKIDTFLENYHKIYDFIDDDFDNIVQTMEYQFGWCDIFMQVAYFICGKNYSVNNILTETHLTPDYENSQFSLVHKYKEYY